MAKRLYLWVKLGEDGRWVKHRSFRSVAFFLSSVGVNRFFSPQDFGLLQYGLPGGSILRVYIHWAGAGGWVERHISWEETENLRLLLRDEEEEAANRERGGPVSTVWRRCFELVGGGHNKFWTIELIGKKYFVTYGRIGTAGSTQVKEFGSVGMCREKADKIVREKTGKGYVSVADTKHPGAPRSMLDPSDRDAVPEQVSAPRISDVEVGGFARRNIEL